MRETASIAFASLRPALPPRPAFAIESDCYPKPSGYDRDLAAVRTIWSGAGIPGTYGCFVFLTYLTCLLWYWSARTGGAARMANSMLGGQAERLFLECLLGLACDRPWSGGIRNARVRRMAAATASSRPGYIEHFQYVGGCRASCKRIGGVHPWGNLRARRLTIGLTRRD